MGLLYLYLVITLCLCILYDLTANSKLLPYTTISEWFRITEVESVYFAVRTGSLHKQTRLLFNLLNAELNPICWHY